MKKRLSGKGSFTDHINNLALSVPRVGQSKEVWLRAINSLEERGADKLFTSECRRHIEDGVALELPVEPPKREYYNSGMVKKHLETAIKRIEDYIHIKAVQEVKLKPDGASVQPLIVVMKEGRKHRLCLDLSRNLNDFVTKRKFRLQAVKEAVLASSPGCWYGKMDLSSCFLSFPLAKESANKMHFKLDGKLFKFTSVPFGLTSAPRVISQLLDVVSSVMVDQGIKHIRYLDDFLFIDTNKNKVEQAMVKAAALLRDFGLCNNLEKLEGPAQAMEFLGVMIDSRSESLYLPEEKIAAMKASLTATLSMRAPGVKHLRSLLGTMSHLSSVLPAARPFMRSLVDQVYRRKACKGRRRLSRILREDLKFWGEALEGWNGTQKWCSKEEPIVVAMDASCSGFGWVVESAPASIRGRLPKGMRPGDAVVGVWSEELRELQAVSNEIGWGEMYSPAMVIQKMGTALKGAHIVFVLDNSGDTAILNRRKTRNERIAGLLRYICKQSLKLGFTFTSVHRPGAVNCLPDVLSREEEHEFKLSVADISRAVDRVRAKNVKSAATAPPPRPFEYGQFFLRDPVSLACSSTPVLYPSSVTLLRSTLEI